MDYQRDTEEEEECPQKLKLLVKEEFFSISDAINLSLNEDPLSYKIDPSESNYSREQSPKDSYVSYVDSNQEAEHGHLKDKQKQGQNGEEEQPNNTINVIQDVPVKSVSISCSSTVSEEGSASNSIDCNLESQDGDSANMLSTLNEQDIIENSELIRICGEKVVLGFEQLENDNSNENYDLKLKRRGRLSGNRRGGVSKRGRRTKICGDYDISSASIYKISPQTPVAGVPQSQKSPLQNRSVNHSIEDAAAANTVAAVEAKDVSGSSPISSKPCPHRMVTKRFRGKSGIKASMCKNGLHCRLHDVLAPTSTILDNCMHALNIPPFATIQLMNYGDEIFELETKRLLRVPSGSNDDNSNVFLECRDLGVLKKDADAIDSEGTN